MNCGVVMQMPKKSRFLSFLLALLIFLPMNTPLSNAGEPWQVYETVNDFGDPQYVAVYRFDSTSGLSYFLAVGCTAGYFEIQSFNPSRANVKTGFRIRYDQNKAVSWKASEKGSTQIEGSNYWSYTFKSPKQVFRTLLRSRSFAVELRSTTGSFLRSSYQISGLVDISSGLKNAGCAW
jgi:hypothetical protein